LLGSICDIDETPLPFEYLGRQSYANKSSKSVRVKTSNNDWDKHQAMIILAAFGSGKLQVRLTIIFHRKEGNGSRRVLFY